MLFIIRVSDIGAQDENVLEGFAFYRVWFKIYNIILIGKSLFMKIYIQQRLQCEIKTIKHFQIHHIDLKTLAK